MVSFTGSDAVGRRIAVAAGGQLKRVALELGGKSAAVVLDDADLDVAVSAVFRQSMLNSGQACVCQSRLLVPRQRLREAEDRLRACAGAWSVGDPFDPQVQMGPLASAAQLERAQGFIARADAAGLRRLFGGQRPPGVDRGFYLSPTAYTEVPPQADLAQHEVFGPVLAVIPYDDDDQAVAIANGTAFGLSGAVWSGDAQRAERFARRLRTGQVVLNGAPQNLAAPFGGFGHSGQGRENGRFSIEAFLELQALQRPLA
jgi:aldehyde dehydrogenase (NAD+)